MKYLVIICLLMLPSRSIYSQGTLLFSGDSVSAEACAGSTLIDRLFIYNISDHVVRLHWFYERLDIPNDGNEFFIAGGYQYSPGVNMHAFYLYPGDSAEVVFHIYAPVMFPGDSVIWHVRFYDEADSAQTSTLLTAIMVCPLSIGIAGLNDNPGVKLFPNPFTTSTEISTDILIDQARIFDLSGRFVHAYRFENGQMIMNRNGLKPGMYMTAFYDKNIQVGLVKMIVSD